MIGIEFDILFKVLCNLQYCVIVFFVNILKFYLKRMEYHVKCHNTFNDSVPKILVFGSIDPSVSFFMFEDYPGYFFFLHLIRSVLQTDSSVV